MLINTKNQNTTILPQRTDTSELIIIVDTYEEQTNQYFVICFNGTLLIILDSYLHQISNLFNSKNSTIYFIKPNIKQLFLSKINNSLSKNIELDHNFEIEIDSFSQKLNLNNQQLVKFWKKIRRSISGYFIKQSYIKSNFNRIKNYKKILETKPTEFIIKENEYIFLRHSGDSNSSHIELLYHIEKEELFVIKIIFDSEEPKLFQRELDNYLDCHHPFLSRYYGTIENGQKKYLAIEYINGKTLSHIDEMNLDFYDRARITFEIMIGIQYIHNKGYIYRDLKPNNIMIDENKNCIIIDFDRMVKNCAENTGFDSTKSFNVNFGAPELFDEVEYSKEVDIYSLGKIINFIFFQNENKINEITRFKIFPEEYTIFMEICNKCIQDDPKKRAEISELLIDLFNYIYLKYFLYLQFDGDFLDYWSTIIEFSYTNGLNIIGMHFIETKKDNKDYNKGFRFLKLAANNNDSASQRNLGNYYLQNQMLPFDINKSIKYHTQATKNNDVNSMYKLFEIYISLKNEEKAFYYLTEAANKNHKEAQYYLGILYFSGHKFPQDINKSIFYLTLSAEQGYSEAQYLLGKLLLIESLPFFDKDKAIKYLKLAADQNNKQAQKYLSIIYSKGICSQKDLNKAMEYSLLSSDFSESETYFRIGYMYYYGTFLSKNIKMAVEYFLKAANKNNLLAYNFLGLIYCEGIYVPKNINKALKYFSYAADHNLLISQYNLGIIYYKGRGVAKDYEKAYKYFNLSLNNGCIESKLMIGIMFLKGKYVKKNVNKGISYIKDAANKNDPAALNYLACMYYRGEYFPKDINLSLYYLKLSADQGNMMAQYNLGFAYYENKYIKRDIQEAIKYFKLAADKNYYGAYYLLGLIYYDGVDVPKDIKKAYDYFVLAAQQNMKEALYYLGIYNINGYYIKKNIKQGINYLMRSASQNLDVSQNYLGTLYYFGKIVPRNIDLAIDYLSFSAFNYNDESLYLLGIIYHQGMYVNRNIKDAIFYYKQASSFNNCFAKNNLAIIYKNGFDCKIDIAYAIELLEEAIKKNNDPIAMYNLAHIFFFNDDIKNDIDRSIFLLKNSYIFGFGPADIFLCLVLVSKFKYFTSSKVIKDEIDDGIENVDDFAFNLFHYIKTHYLEDDFGYKPLYDQIKENDYTYDNYEPVFTKDFMNNEKKQILSKDKRQNITEEFYLGFGIF